MTTSVHPLIRNPHLNGDPFLLSGGRVGIQLIHGLSATTTDVRPLAERLHAAGYTVSGPLLPGHNTTPKDANRYSWKDWLEAARADYLQLTKICERVFVGGVSTGGVLALYLASEYPEIAGVLTYAPALKLRLKWYDKLQLNIFSLFIAYVDRKGHENDLPWRGYLVMPLKGAVQLLKLQKATMPKLKQIAQPVLVIQGALDTTVDPGVPKTIMNTIQSEVKSHFWMANSSHVVTIDREIDQVTAITRQFLSQSQGILDAN